VTHPPHYEIDLMSGFLKVQEDVLTVLFEVKIANRRIITPTGINTLYQISNFSLLNGLTDESDMTFLIRN